MTRSRLLLAALLVAIVALSFFAPEPVTRVTQADQSQACEGLNRAYDRCTANGAAGCGHIWEQLRAHGCYGGSASGSGSTSGSGSWSGSGSH